MGKKEDTQNELMLVSENSFNSSVGSATQKKVTLFLDEAAKTLGAKPRFFACDVTSRGAHLYFGNEREKAALVTSESEGAKTRRKRADFKHKVKVISGAACEFFKVVWHTITKS